MVNASEQQSRQLPSSMVAREFGEVNVRRAGAVWQVNFTILMEPQGSGAEGWQTGVALDASASMKAAFGRALEGKVPPGVFAEYQRRGLIERRNSDGRIIEVMKKEAYADAVERGVLKFTENSIQPLAREFLAYLADTLDADGRTTLVYWACGDGSAVEPVGDFSAEECKGVELRGPTTVSFGAGTKLAPAMKYFADRFADAKRGMYIFLTDGRLDDLEAVKAQTTAFAREIEAGRRNSLKCVLIGIGPQIEEGQMEELDDLDTGTSVDIWDHKIASEMRALVEIFAEVVDENVIVAPRGAIYDQSGAVARNFPDGVPARASFEMPISLTLFELEVGGQRIRQSIVPPN